MVQWHQNVLLSPHSQDAVKTVIEDYNGYIYETGDIYVYQKLFQINNKQK